MQAQRQSVNQPSGRLWMLAASRSVQQQESEARQELDGLEAEREAAMQAGVTGWANCLQVITSKRQTPDIKPVCSKHGLLTSCAARPWLQGRASPASYTRLESS